MCKIFFDDKATEIIKLQSTPHNHVVRSSIPCNLTDFNVSLTIYNIERSIHLILMYLYPSLIAMDCFKTLLSFHVVLKDIISWD